MKRNTRTYKIPDKPYEKALNRGKGLLAPFIEAWVIAYGEGATIEVIPKKVNKSQKKL